MSRILITTAFIWLILNPLSAINHYIEGDTLYVWALSGLSLRDSADLSSERTHVIPYGETLTVQATKLYRNSDKEIVLSPAYKGEDGIAYEKVTLYGRWVKVKCGDLEGYVFNGFLSMFSPPDKKSHLYLDDWIRLEFVLISEVDKQNGEQYYTHKIYGGGN